MGLGFYLNVLSGGLLTGLVYGLAALGLSVIFGVIRVVNFAHGELMVAGMYAAVLLAVRRHIDPVLAAPLVAAGLFLVGYALQRFLINRFIGAPDHQQFILLAGVAMMLMNGMLMIYGPDARSAQLSYSFDTLSFGPLLFDRVRVRAAGVAVVVTAALFLFFNVTRTGKAIRACADNPFGARAIGLDVDHLYAFTFGLGAAIAGIAGCLMTLIVDVRPPLAQDYTLLSFIVVIVGGLGSAGGALLGGVLIGMSEALAGALLTPSMKGMFSYALLVLVLALRPHGLMGQSR